MNDLKILNDLVILLARLTATRAGYLDNLSAGAVAQNATVAKDATVALNATVAKEATLNKAVFFKDQWCATPIASLAFSNVAGDKNFADVDLPLNFLPAGATIQAVHLMVHWRKQVDTSAALNAINAANKTIRIKKAADGWAASLVAITMANGSLSTALSATEGGTIIISASDIKAKVNADNTTYNIRSDETTCADGITVTAASLTLWDIFTGLRVYFTVA